MSTSRTRDILFKGAMVRAILRAREARSDAVPKTETRRVPTARDYSDEYNRRCKAVGVRQATEEYWDTDHLTCPYGQAGDELLVREAFRLPEWADDISPSEYAEDDRFVKGTPPVRFEADGRATPFYNYVTSDGWGRKRPSIFLPHALCRLRLRVEEVRLERVQEIDAEGVMREGITAAMAEDYATDAELASQEHTDDTEWLFRNAFRNLWNDINAGRDGYLAWRHNPWVWVMSFSKLNEYHA